MHNLIYLEHDNSYNQIGYPKLGHTIYIRKKNELETKP